MEENIKELVLDGLSSLYKEGKFDTLSSILDEYLRKSSEVIKKTPSDLHLSQEQRINTLKITEIVAFVNSSFKNIPIEKLVIPALLSCIELSLWEKIPEGQKIIKASFDGYAVYFLPVFIDFYFRTSCISQNSNGQVEKINYSIKKLIFSNKYKDFFRKLSKDIIRKKSEEEWLIYKKHKNENWFGITSFILTRENDIVRTFKEI
jgi:hypothetical protein